MSNTFSAHKNVVVDGGFSFAPKAPEPISEQINAKIDAALERHVAVQKPRGYLGGSRVGLDCLRQLGYEYFRSRENFAAYQAAASHEHLTPHTFPGKVIRRFELGHMHEDLTALWLRRAGFELDTHKPDGGQYGFYAARDPETGEARFSGHFDGIVRAGPVSMPYPALWEHKIMASKKWRECQERGVRHVYPVYFYQMQTYMAYADLRNALFTALNTDTSELLFELVPFETEAAQWATDRAVRVLTASSPEELPRVASNDTDYRCKFCPFAEQCWKSPKADTLRPHWL